MHNAFVFDGRHGVKAYLWKSMGVVMWQFCLLECLNYLFDRIFILPIGDLAFPTTHVAMTQLKYATIVVFFTHEF